MPITPDVKMGKNVTIPHPELVNLYGCVIGDQTKIGSFVEIQKGAKVGNFCKISSHSFLCEGVVIEDKVFVGHGVLFTNDRYPKAAQGDKLQTEADWKVISTLVKSEASLGSGSVILCGVTIGKGALVGAGTVVTKDVPDYAIVVGVPGKVTGDVRKKSE
jgi:UDP-2-acetamido-3-amino-2,3-dideoxy-glucuronate N-acetyltransferase